ncbi:MAG: hypothetical protein UIM53_07375 [Acutalibacteraceae bacterium]|nr:hypothetical protein [Acutalibacteraceae bacterium]
MSKDRYDNIEYNDEWQSVPVVRATPVELEDDYEDEVEKQGFADDEDYPSQEYPQFCDSKKYKADNNPQPVIKLQFFLAILILIGAFLLKGVGGEIYTTVKNWYFENLNNSLVITMQNPTEQKNTLQKSTEYETSIQQPTEQETLNQETTEQETSEQQLTEQNVADSNLDDSIPQD